MVRQRGDPLGDQCARGLLDRCARQAVDDARLARVLGADQLQQLRQGLRLGLDAVLDVRPVEAGHEQLSLAEVEPRGDLEPGLLGGRRGESDARHGRPSPVQNGQSQIVGPEVVPPLRHAVRLIDREQRDGGAVEEVER